MTPTFAAQDHGNGGARHAELRGDFLLAHTSGASLADGLDLILRELGRSVTAPPLIVSTPTSSALGVHVPHVVSLSTEKEVRGIYAGRVVAVVENEHTRRDWPIGKFPGDSVSASAFASTTVRRNAVAPIGLSPEPPPTAPGLVHAIPELFA